MSVLCCVGVGCSLFLLAFSLSQIYLSGVSHWLLTHLCLRRFHDRNKFQLSRRRTPANQRARLGTGGGFASWGQSPIANRQSRFFLNILCCSSTGLQHGLRLRPNRNIGTWIRLDNTPQWQRNIRRNDLSPVSQLFHEQFPL